MLITSSIYRPERRSQPWSSLLEGFYTRAGLCMPRLEKLADAEVPQPYRKLLVHSTDLTPTLEAFYQQTLGLTVLGRRREDACYLREVVLHLAGTGRRVAYGVIRIALELLPPSAAKRVLEEQVPFGSILQREGIPHLSWPQAFFSAKPDLHIRGVLGIQSVDLLYGRRNVLLDRSRRLLAEVIEILAQIPAPGREDITPCDPSPGRNGKLEEDRR